MIPFDVFVGSGRVGGVNGKCSRVGIAVVQLGLNLSRHAIRPDVMGI